MIKNTLGMTLIEICIIAVVLSAILMVVWPVFGRLGSATKFDTYIKPLANTVSIGREKAISESKHYCLQFDAKTGRYNILVEEDPVNKPGEFVAFPDGLDTKRLLPDGLQIKAISGNKLVLNPDGTTDEFQITVADQSGKTCIMKVQGVSGKVSIEYE